MSSVFFPFIRRIMSRRMAYKYNVAPGHDGVADRIAVIGTAQSFISSVLLESLIAVTRERTDISIGCVVESVPMRSVQRLRSRCASVEQWVKRSLNPDKQFRSYTPLKQLAEQHGIPVLNKKGGRIDMPDMLALLTAHANIIFSVANHQILSAALLARFAYGVNYHNSLLPRYRGIGATSLSLYHQQTHTGFTFHILTEGLDAGNVLIQDAVPVDRREGWYAHEWKKVLLAATRVPELLTLITSRSAGTPQHGEASSYSCKALKRFATIDDARALSVAEIERRIRAFGGVYLHGRYVTAVKSDSSGIRVRDGHIRIVRIADAPPWLWRIVTACIKK